jgi:hypothetical protein
MYSVDILKKLTEHPNFKSVIIFPTDYEDHPTAAGKISVEVHFKDSEWKKMGTTHNTAFVDDIAEGLFTGYIVMVASLSPEELKR